MTGASTAVRRAATNRSAILEPGTILGGRYEIILMLGIGGMGAVYKAYDRDIDRLIALKVIRPDLMASSGIIQRFKQELILARQVTHRNVIRIHDLGEADGIKFITMEYIEGEPLTNILQSRGKLPPREAAEIIEQVGFALQTAHAEGVVHRDLKPANIMRDSHGRIVVMDFGLAHSMDVPITHSGNRATKSIDATLVLDTDLTAGNSDVGHLVGTPLYMSPEQARREETDWRSDIYTLGLIFYELLSGAPPFRGRNAIETLNLRLEQKPKPLVEVDAGIPRRLSNLVGRCLERAPKNRYQSMQELLGDLRGYLHPARKTWRWAIAGAAILVLAVTQIIIQQRLPRKAAAEHAPVSVLVSDFKNNTGESVFDGALEPAISVALEGASFITDYNRGTAHKLAAKLQPGATTLDEQLARLVATREGINAIVTGEISRNGDSYQVTVNAIDGMTGKNIATKTAQVDKEHVLVTMGTLAATVRKALGDTTPQSVQIAAADTFTTGSLEAAHEYGLCQNAQLAGQWEQTIEHCLAATKIDPDLGRAYVILGATYHNTGQVQQGEKYFQLALSKIDRMSDREKYRTRGAYYLLAREPDKAIEQQEQLVKQYPADSAGIANLALAYFYRRDMPRALSEGRRAIEIYPKNVAQRNNVGLFAMYAGDFDTAIREQQTVLQMNPSMVLGYVGTALSQIGLGHPEQAAETYHQLERIGPAGTSAAATGLADLALYQGRPADAIKILEAAIPQDLAAKNADAAAAKLSLLSEADLQVGKVPTAIADAERALAQSKEDNVMFWAARAYLEAKNYAKALDLAGQLGNRLKPDSQAYAKLIEGEVEFKRGKLQDAIKDFVDSRKIADTWMGRFDAARAYVEAGAYPEADSEIEICQKRRGEATALFLDESPTYHLFPPVYYYLGRAQEGLQSPAAAESYKNFINTKADGGQDPLLADAHHRAELK